MSNVGSDIKNQVLSDYLILKREAISLYTKNYPWAGLNKLKTLISGIPLSVENYKRADEIVNSIEKIENDSNKITGSDAESTASVAYEYRGIMAQKIFDSTLRTITRILQNQGYFEFLTKTYGPKLSELDLSKAEEY